MKMEKAFVVESVNSAAVLLEKEGRAAFNTLRDKKSEYNYKDTYVFIIDEKGTLLLDPPFPALEGRNVYDYKDPSGKYLFREMIDMANSQGSGWVEYMWPKPDTMEYEKKGSFIKKVKVGNEVLIVGTGMYLEGYRSCTIYSIP
jgi:signal transduction histidine kinase